MVDPVQLPGGAVLRPLAPGDAPAILDAYLRNREHLRPYEPVRPDSFWTLDGQQARLDELLRHQEDDALSCVIVRGARIIGGVNLSRIAYGPFGSGGLGYWVDEGETGRGLAGAAVGALCRIADEDLGLHRIEAGTLTGNLASQRVLAKNGFRQFGLARDYLYIAGRWQDHRMFERILNDRAPGSPA